MTELENNRSMSTKVLVSALDKAVQVQTGAIEGYVNWMRRKHPEANPAEVQRLVDKHFLWIATGSGAGVGTAAAVPGIGFFYGALAIGAESLVFVDAVAFYVMASAKLRGIDISHPERRRALILIVLLGASGTALVDAMVASKAAPVAAISKFSVGRLVEANNQMIRLAVNQVTKKIRNAWLGKMVPLGIGAVLGTMANRKLAKKAVANAHESLGAIPAAFSFELPAKPTKEEKKASKLASKR